MALQQVRFAIQSSETESSNVSSQRAVNMYAEKQPPDSKTDVAVFNSPGVADFAELGNGPIRGMIAPNDETLYVVSDTLLYSVDSDGAANVLGGSVDGSDPVSMDSNGDQVAIVNGTQGYIYDTSAGFRVISDGDFHSANTTTFMDSFFIFDWAGTSKFFMSDSLDGSAYDGLNFASAEAKPDNVLAVKSYQQRLNVLGHKSIEPWSNVGAANFPFQRIPGGLIERGIIGSRAVTTEDNSLFILGNDRIAYRITGITLQRISAHSQESIWQNYATVEDVLTMAHTFDGHKFIVYTFPTEAATWIYDIASGLWHERASWDLNNTPLGRWRANCTEEAFNKTLIGDAFSGKIGYLSHSTFTEFGNTMQAEMVSPPIHANGEWFTIPRFQIDLEAGVGTISGQGSDPQVMLSISRDGGNTWSDQELWTGMGANGAYGTRVYWDRLGGYYDCRFKVTISDPVRRTIVRAMADVQVGMT